MEKNYYQEIKFLMGSTFTNITFEELQKTIFDILLLNGVEFYKAEKVVANVAHPRV